MERALGGVRRRELALVSDDVSAEAPRRKGAKAYFVASLTAQGCALVRNIVLARILGPEKLGLAATLILTATFFDLISDTGGDRFLIQDRDGDRPETQGMVQSVYVLRGLGIAAILTVFSATIASFYGDPALRWPLVFLGLSPAIMGFIHLDIRRKQRHHDFLAEAVGQFIGESLSLVVTVAAALITRDFTAALYGLVIRSLVMVVVSHVMRERPYRLGFSRPQAGRLALFAAPLMINGVIIYLGGQGDRVFIAKLVGAQALGHYSAILLLIYNPSMVIYRYMNALYLPRLAAARGDPAANRAVSDQLAVLTFGLSVAMAVGFTVVAPFAIKLLYGSIYEQSLLVIALIGVLQTFRFMIAWPTTMAMASGRTNAVLISNATRLVAWPLAFAIGHAWSGLVGVIVGFILGECVALLVALVLVARNRPAVALQGFVRTATFSAVCACIVALASRHWTGAPSTLALVAVALSIIGAAFWRDRAVLTTTVAGVLKR
jgi:O-antigen/teichoic acid export membrane protein